MLVELWKDLLGEKEPSKFQRNATGDGESLKNNEETNDIGEELDIFQVGDLPVYYADATSLILLAMFWWIDPMGEENV